MKKILLILLSVIIASNAKVNSELIQKIYHDGLFDAFMQIEKSIETGLSENKIVIFNNKYIVCKNIDNISFVNILLLKTIAIKNNINKTFIVKDKSGHSIIVFGAYNRKPDAEYVANVLRDNNIKNINVKYNKENFYNNPIIARRFLNDVENMLANLPIKVISVEKVILQKEKIKKKQYIPISLASKNNTTKSENKNSSKNKTPISSNLLYKKYDIIKKYFFQHRNIVDFTSQKINYKDRYVKVGENIDQDFKLYALKKKKQDLVIILLGKNQLYYKFRIVNFFKNKSVFLKSPKEEKKYKNKENIQKIKNNKKNEERAISQKIEQKVNQIKQENNKKIPQNTKPPSKQRYVCDFSKLTNFAYSLYPSYRMNQKKITALQFQGNTPVILVRITIAADGKFCLIKTNETKSFYIRKEMFDYACKQSK